MPAGTNFFIPAPTDSTMSPAFTEENGLLLYAKCTSTPPTTANVFQHGCMMIQTDSGTGTAAMYQNIGSSAVPSWSLLDTASASLILPTSATDSTSTNGTSLLLTESTLTSGSGVKVVGSTGVFTTGGALFKADLTAAVAGNGFTAVTTGAYTGTGLLVLTANGLTTGVLANLTHTTSVIADGGSLLRLASSSVDTGGATNGTVLDVKSTGQLAGTVVRFDNILTTGTGISVIGTGVMTTTGNLLTLTANSATTAAGLLRINGNALTDGIGEIISSSSTALTSTGRLFKVDHTGNAGVSTVIAEVASAAADETVVFKATASAAITGVVSQTSALATVSGIAVEARATAATLTTGRYYSANDAATEVFGVGANGHVHSTVSAAPPTIAVSQQNGITAAAITAGGSDTCGIITTTGTNNNGGTSILQVTFGKTYTTAPKTVLLFPLNTSGSKTAATSLFNPIISAKTATTFDITIPQDAGAGATPSWAYLVIA